MKRKLIVVAACTLALAVSGCSKYSKRDNHRGHHHVAGEGAYSEDITYEGGVDEGSRFSGRDDYSGNHENLLSKRVYRFGYDSYELSSHDLDALAAHAEYLKQNNHKHVRIEGHTDERGSREYNIGLGERRAKAVGNYLLSKGIKHNQFSIVSYGKEKPEVRGSSETDYKLNRRAVIVYEG